MQRRPELADVYFMQFLNDQTLAVGGGGIGTLISYLCPVLTAAGFRTTGRLEIFAADFFSVPNTNPLAIAVQNGLAWDAPIEILTARRLFRSRLGEKAFRFRRQLKGLRYFENCFNRLAVDLYFVNWYRSFRGPGSTGRIWYNPNPAGDCRWPAERDERTAADPVRVIFARRLVPEKGTRLIADVFADLLRLRPCVRITLAGDGPERAFLAKTFAAERRVTITSYAVEETLSVHKAHDVAVIPSICGEATCLSVVEAMAAGCAVVATNLGGTITQIISQYNGLLAWPTRESLLQNLLYLVDHPSQRLQMQRRAWEVARTAFGMEAWKQRWLSILNEVIAGEDDAAGAMGVAAA
jgi:glycosyltransferase involved in cell wall biosynthesis